MTASSERDTEEIRRTETNAEDFAIFSKAVTHYLDKYGVKGYEVEILHYTYDENAKAACVFDTVGRGASITLSEEWDDGIDKDGLIRAAFHEVMELLLGDIHIMITSRGFSEDLAATEIHRVIRTLENVEFNTEK